MARGGGRRRDLSGGAQHPRHPSTHGIPAPQHRTSTTNCGGLPLDAGSGDWAEAQKQEGRRHWSAGHTAGGEGHAGRRGSSGGGGGGDCKALGPRLAICRCCAVHDGGQQARQQGRSRRKPPHSQRRRLPAAVDVLARLRCRWNQAEGCGRQERDGANCCRAVPPPSEPPPSPAAKPYRWARGHAFGHVGRAADGLCAPPALTGLRMAPACRASVQARCRSETAAVSALWPLHASPSRGSAVFQLACAAPYAAAPAAFSASAPPHLRPAAALCRCRLLRRLSATDWGLARIPLPSPLPFPSHLVQSGAQGRPTHPRAAALGAGALGRPGGLGSSHHPARDSGSPPRSLLANHDALP